MAKKNEIAVDPSNAEFLPSAGGPLPGELLTPMAEPEGGWPADEFTGVGGSYVRDPITGIRTRAQPVDEPK